MDLGRDLGCLRGFGEEGGVVFFDIDIDISSSLL